MKLVISGQTPSLKNRKQLFVRNGKPHMIANHQHRQWETDALWQLKGKPPVENYPVALTCVFYMKDNRARDLDNCLTSVQDVLVKAGIIKGDHWQLLAPVTADCAGIDAKDPRVEIWLDE